MRRRTFITLLGGAAAVWPLTARAQGERVRRIGVLGVTEANDPQSFRRAMALEQGLEKLGWTIGHNLHVDYRWGASDNERARAGAAELSKLAPDLILATSVPAVRAVQQTAAAIPIVFVGVSEPVSLGLVSSLARPGGNITGFTNMEPSLGGKWLELLREIAPGVKRVAFMFDPVLTPITPLFFRSVKSAAPKLAVEPVLAHVQRLDRSTQRLHHGQSQTDRGAGAPESLAIDLCIQVFRRRRWADLLRPRCGRPVPARSLVCGQDPSRRPARRSAGPAADQVRAGHQPQDRQGARPRSATDAARARRRGDRIAKREGRHQRVFQGEDRHETSP